MTFYAYLEELEKVLATFEPERRNEAIRWQIRRLAETGRASVLLDARSPTRLLSDALDRAMRGENVELPSGADFDPVYEYFEQACEGEFVSWAEILSAPWCPRCAT